MTAVARPKTALGLVLIAAVLMLAAGRMLAMPPAALAPGLTVTVYDTVIDGHHVTCTETFDHQTGAHSRGC